MITESEPGFLLTELKLLYINYVSLESLCTVNFRNVLSLYVGQSVCSSSFVCRTIFVCSSIFVYRTVCM